MLIPGVAPADAVAVSSTTNDIDVMPYSFGVSARLTAEKAALYQEASSEIATRVGVLMKDWLPAFSVEAGPLLEADAGSELIEDIEEFESVVVIHDGMPAGSLLVERALALALINDLLGGGHVPVGLSRSLTTIERRVIDLLLAPMLSMAADVLLLDEPSLGRDKSDGFVAGKDDEPEALVGFVLSFVSPSGAGRLIIELELPVLQDFSDAIDRRLSGRRFTPPSIVLPSTAAALDPVPLPLTVELGRLVITAGDVVSLEPGDVLRTRRSVDEPMSASVGDQHVFDVRMGRNGNQLVAEVISLTVRTPTTAAPQGGLTMYPFLDASNS